jgi:hypothetical protein
VFDVGSEINPKDMNIFLWFHLLRKTIYAPQIMANNEQRARRAHGRVQ